MVFQNKMKVEAWLAGVYSGIPNPSSNWLNSHGWEIFGDDLNTIQKMATVGMEGIYQRFFGEWTPNTQWDGGYWHRMPQLIRQAYIFMERAVALPNADLPQEEVDNMKAECRFFGSLLLLVNGESIWGPYLFNQNTLLHLILFCLI